MQLRFLGTPYFGTSATVATSELNVSGKYRGNQVSFRSPQSKVFGSVVALQYRGTNYLR